MVIDSFAVRSDRGSAMVEERWHLGRTSPAPENCAVRSAHADYAIEDQSVDITPMCAMLDTTESASQGRIVASSLAAGSFEDDGLVEFVNRLGVTEQRSRVRYVPDEAVDVDVRFFALMSAPSDETLPEAEFTWDTCSGAPCVEVELPSGTWSFSFTWEGERWVLSDVAEP